MTDGAEERHAPGYANSPSSMRRPASPRREEAVPKSRVRKKAAYTPPPAKSDRKKYSAPWVGPVMLTLFLLGIIWLVVYYVTQGDIPGMRTLKDWNLAVG